MPTTPAPRGPVTLTRNEHAILTPLLAAPGALVPYANLVPLPVWGATTGRRRRRSLSVHLCMLREKLRLGGWRLDAIETVPGVGLRWVGAVTHG